MNKREALSSPESKQSKNPKLDAEKENQLIESASYGYRLASTPYPKAKIDTTTDLFKTFGLEDIAKDVARRGENPKKMGKTYKKHMRLMKLSGKFDAVKKREDEMGFVDMLQIPDDEWNQTETLGKDMNPGQTGLSATARSSLAQAMTMSKGRIPRERWDVGVLGLERRDGGKGGNN